MPTPTGLPKRGEVWELDIRIPGHPRKAQKVVILNRGLGEYWSLRVYTERRERALWVDCAYWLKMGWLKYVGPAGPDTRKKLGI